MKKNKGITLIALIITIILLLILVGVSINLAIKGNLFGSAEKAVSATNDKVGKQQSIIDELMDEFDAMEAEICSHIWKDGAILKESTCTAEGKKQKVCENCKKVIEIETPALGHNFVNRVCTRCGEKEPGCTTHTFGDWVITKNATCVAEGSKKRTCTVCGVEEIETIAATGVHTYGEWKVTKQATCTADGTKTKTCTGCGATQTEVIAKLGHNFVEGKCSVCGETLVIGANINYHEYISESGGTVSTSYTSTKAKRGSTAYGDSNSTYSIVNNSGIQWIVLGEENGQIKITTKNIVQPTSGGYIYDIKYLRLQGQTGYDNFIDELNKISTVYGKGKYADTTKFSNSGGRSFKMEDLGYEINAGNDTYGGSQTLPTSVSNADKNYWLASNYIYNAAGFVYYYVSNRGEIDSEYLYDGGGGYSTLSSGVRPVVYLKSNIKLSYHETNGYTLSY